MHSIKDQLNTSRKPKREDFADYNRLMSTSIGSGKSASVSDSWLCNNQLMALLMILCDFLHVAFQLLYNIQGVLSPVKMNMCVCVCVTSLIGNYIYIYRLIYGICTIVVQMYMRMCKECSKTLVSTIVEMRSCRFAIVGANLPVTLHIFGLRRVWRPGQICWSNLFTNFVTRICLAKSLGTSQNHVANI